MASNALSVVGRLNSTLSMVKSHVTGQPATEMGRGRQLTKTRWEERKAVSKGGEVDQFHK